METMMILIHIQYIKPLSEVDQYRKAHIVHLEHYYQQNLIHASGPYNNREGGFIISNMSTNEAKSYIDNDPYHIAQVATFKLIDFSPTKSSELFTLLIDKDHFPKEAKALFNSLHGQHAGERLINTLSNISPEFTDLTFNFAFGEILSRPLLPMLLKELLIIAMCAVLGDTQKQLHSHIDAAYNLGATTQMIVEVLLLAIPIIGFPRVANVLLTLKEIVERKNANSSIAINHLE